MEDRVTNSSDSSCTPSSSPFTPDSVAVALYKEGKEFRRYLLTELVIDRERIPRTLGMGSYMWLEEQRFDLAANHVTIVTAEQREMTFDITTGAIVPPAVKRSYASVLLGAGLLICVIVGVVLSKRKQRPLEEG